VSQRPIALHGMEHLGATDRGVSMFRRQIRGGIASIRADRDPPGVCHEPGAVISTYCNDTVLRVAPPETASMDKKMMRETGRRLAEGYRGAPPLVARR